MFDVDFLSSVPSKSNKARVILSTANLILVLTCLTTSQYLSFLFLAMRSANLLTNCLHSFDIPPDVRNTAMF